MAILGLMTAEKYVDAHSHYEIKHYNGTMKILFLKAFVIKNTYVSLYKLKIALANTRDKFFS